MVDNLCMIAGFLIISFSTNFELLLVGKENYENDNDNDNDNDNNDCVSGGRLLTGHSSGSNLVSSPIFVSEISHPDLRGASSVLTMVCYTSGFFVSMLGGASLSWRMAALSYNTTSLLSLTMLVFCKESPSWLLRAGKDKEALASLFFYRGDMDIAK